LAYPVVVAAAVIAVWAALSAGRVFPAAQIPAPGEVARAFGAEARSGQLFVDIIASLFRVAVGFTLAAVVGIPLGLWLGHVVGARAALLPAVNFLRNLSPIAWIPFAILWFGIGDSPAIFLIFMAAFAPLCLATAAAVGEIPSVYFRVARDYGLTGRSLLTQVTLPAILPQVITTLRLVMGVSWVVVVAAEMIAGRDGLGYLIWDARNGLRMDLLVMGMISIGLLGVLLDRLMVRLTRLPFVRWGYDR
jgi:NitT/TauT family transport system permease protein